MALPSRISSATCLTQTRSRRRLRLLRECRCHLVATNCCKSLPRRGGSKAPVHETFVRLSRDGGTATIPMEQLVKDPNEDLYAQPGDVLTLVQVPQTFSVFGATGRNAKIDFGAPRITLAEALAKSQGLRDDLAKPEGVFLFRYEPNSIVRALRSAGRPRDTKRSLAGRIPLQPSRRENVPPRATVSRPRQGRHLCRRRPRGADL